jgi:sphingomyelin phosphodiesterase 2
MAEELAARVAVVSLNTRGVPIVASNLAGRYAVIGAALDHGDADIACLQEVFTWWHLRLLTRRMRSFRYVSFRPSPIGPAGGLVTFSRLPVSGTAYRAFGLSARAPGISLVTWLRAARKGALITGLARPELRIVNTHPVANRDGDWSRNGRFYPLHASQLAILTQVVCSISTPTVVSGDFNVDRGSPLFGEFLMSTGLVDAFEGNCPATFRAEFLPAGQTPHCIDFILTTGGVKAEAAAVVFAGKLPGGRGYVSDHLGLRASLLQAPGTIRLPR